MLPVTLRPAHPNDYAVLAALQVQLHHAETPGVLRGSIAAQERLVRYILESSGADGLRRRYVACTAAGEIVATASLRQPNEAMTAKLPAGTLHLAIRSLGLINTARMLVTMVRAVLIPDRPLPSDGAYIYSVVVDKRYRGQGIGNTLMLGLEEIARQAGARSSWLRVLVGNTAARRFYTHLGYRLVQRSPIWMDPLTLPSELMQKNLLSL